MTRIPLVTDVLDAIDQVLPERGPVVALHEPLFRGREWEYVKDCLDTGWVSSVGKYVDRFEQELAAYTGVRQAIACVNGTAALHMCLHLVGVCPGDEVLVPALTFVATANAVTYCGAVPHFADCDPVSLGIDPARLALYLSEVAERKGDECIHRVTGRRIRALIAMHTFGHPCDMAGLQAICDEFGIQLVEDAAESLGSRYQGQHTGNVGRVAALSFNGNKIVTTGGGGAILTNDLELGRLAKHLTTTAKLPHPWSFNHDQVGYNYRLPNINAALGCAQLEQLDTWLPAKRALASRYEVALGRISEATFLREPPWGTSNYWLNCLLLSNEMATQRDALLAAMHDVGIMARPAWTLMHRLPMYENAPRMELREAEQIERRLLCLPSSVTLGEAC